MRCLRKTGEPVITPQRDFRDSFMLHQNDANRKQIQLWV